MKIKIAVIAALVVVGSALSNRVLGQSARAGIKGGLNVTNLYIDEVDDENARYGFHVGVYGQFLASEAFALQPELLYSTKGNRFVSDGLIDQETKFNLNYIDLPVLAVFKLGPSVELHAGGYVSYLLSSSISTDGDLGSDYDELDRDNFNSVDYGLVGGIGFNVGAIQIGARYNYGLNKIANSDTAEDLLGDSKNSNGQIYVAFNLNQQE